MFISHIALYADDLEKMKDFYVKYFSAEASIKYRNIKTGFESYILSFGRGTKIEIMRKPSIDRLKSATDRMGYHHVAIGTGSKETVDELTTLLKVDGYEVISAPRTTGDGYYESCILDPEQNRVEITV